MARPRIDYERAAAIVIDSMVFGDAKTATMHHISVGSIKRYRKRLEYDPKMIEAVAKLKKRTLKPIEPQTKKAVKEILEWLADLPKHIGEPTPSMVNAMTDAYRAIEEIEFVKRMVDLKEKTLMPIGGTAKTLKEESTVDAIAQEVR